MKKSAINPMPEFFDRYINLVEDIPVVEALEKHAFLVPDSEKNFYHQLGNKMYAPGKWTVKDIIQHLIDAERILAYRALWFARKDKTGLPGFDEHVFASRTDASGRSLPDLLDEFFIVRQASIALFRSFTDDMLRQTGVADGKSISVLALGFVIAGHPLHHVRIIQERYYPLIK